jgi:hypothetical protein
VLHIVGLSLLGTFPQDLCPPRADNDQGYIAVCNGFVDLARKQLPWRYVLDIHENAV